jgi:hypothetical protein
MTDVLQHSLVEKVSHDIFPKLAFNHNSQISASQIARIIGLRHCTHQDVFPQKCIFAL